jgi:hypothetical protein
VSNLPGSHHHQDDRLAQRPPEHSPVGRLARLAKALLTILLNRKSYFYNRLEKDTLFVIQWSPLNGIPDNGIIWLMGSTFLRYSRPYYSQSCKACVG